MGEQKQLVVDIGDLDRVVRSIVRDEVRAALAATGGQAADLVSLASWAAARSLSLSLARQAVRDGRLSCIRIGRSIRVRKDAQLAPRHRAGANAAAERALAAAEGK